MKMYVFNIKINIFSRSTADNLRAYLRVAAFQAKALNFRNLLQIQLG